jgi:hypothetical protein
MCELAQMTVYHLWNMCIFAQLDYYRYDMKNLHFRSKGLVLPINYVFTVYWSVFLTSCFYVTALLWIGRIVSLFLPCVFFLQFLIQLNMAAIIVTDYKWYYAYTYSIHEMLRPFSYFWWILMKTYVLNEYCCVPSCGYIVGLYYQNLNDFLFLCFSVSSSVHHNSKLRIDVLWVQFLHKS